MCGRIAQTHTAEELQETLGITVGAHELESVRVSYNVPPSAVLPALVSTDPGLSWSALVWGFRPYWMRKGRLMINARSETVQEKPMFRHAICRRRCVISTSAYFEWLSVPGDKQPYCIKSGDGTPLFMAGIHENGGCAILTRAAREDLAFIHDRMPMLLPRSLVEPYVSDLGALPAATGAAEALSLQAYAVTRQVGNPRFNGPECMKALEV